VKRPFVLICGLFLICAGCRTEDPNAILFSAIADNKLSVVVFMATDCPISQKYSPTLKQLQQDFEQDSVHFYGVVPGKATQSAELTEYAKTYEISFPIFTDANGDVAGFFGATVTPEVFLVDSDANVLYRGAIDNWFLDIGRPRQVITEHFLRDALNDAVGGREIKADHTTAVGCFIESRL
jgi:thiol-disulfide isomerase/thioredoxin